MAGAKEEKPGEKKVQMSRDEQIGFHKGSLATLAKERQEFSRTLSIVEQLMQMHIKALQELGIDLTKEESGAEQPEHKKPKKPIEDIL
ncbi:MAG: hypothetical protein NTV63_05535 [Candidatus Woesearchaeota archaeon]|nr:hypothetical protein [Candidatus Woesearchaeota archaeon]